MPPPFLLLLVLASAAFLLLLAGGLPRAQGFVLPSQGRLPAPRQHRTTRMMAGAGGGGGSHHHRVREEQKQRQAAEGLLQQFRDGGAASPSTPSSSSLSRLNMVFNTLRPKLFPPPTPPPQQEDAQPSTKTASIVLMAGFEAFNIQLYRQAATTLAEICPAIRLTVFTDRDIQSQPDVVAAELAKADVFFGSLIFDYDQVQWLQVRN